MRILICDHDETVLQQLEEDIKEFFHQFAGITPEFAAYRSEDALLAQETRADMAFLGMEVPGINGVRIGRTLKGQNPYIKIFIIAARPDYLDEAMGIQVFRYLTKPIDKKRLFRNLRDAVDQHKAETQTYSIATNRGVFLRNAEEIICVETQQRKTLVYTTGEVLQSAGNMAYWRTVLTLPCFFSPHRSYIINLRFVNAVEKDTIVLQYRQLEKRVYLARRKYAELKQALALFAQSGA